MLPLRCPDPAIDFASRVPAKESSHLLINKPSNLAIVNYTIRFGKVIVHETHVGVGVGV